MSDTAARARERRIAEIKKRAKQFAVDHNWWSDSDPVVDDLTAFAESELQLAAQSASAELKADTLFGVYCSGNPESIPKDHAIFWEGWQRVADYVNGQLRQHGHGAQGENSCGTAVNAHTLTSEAIHPIVETAERFEAHHLPNEEWKSLSQESREKISKWFNLAEKYLQAILNDGAQGRGVGWVSVKETLPEENQWVATLCAKGHVAARPWNNWRPDYPHCGAKITHWQPLPSAPFHSRRAQSRRGRDKRRNP